jgi:hypothetical protein
MFLAFHKRAVAKNQLTGVHRNLGSQVAMDRGSYRAENEKRMLIQCLGETTSSRSSSSPESSP